MAAKFGGCVDEDHRKLPMLYEQRYQLLYSMSRSFVDLCSVILLLALMSPF